MPTVPPGYVLSRAFMLVCSLILLANTYEVLYFQLTNLSIAQLVAQQLAKSDVRMTQRLMRLDIERMKLSNWLGYHVWPVPIWLFLSFWQTSSLIRRKWLWLHRVAGRGVLLLSLYMTFGYIMMFVTGEQILGEEQFYIDFRNPSKFFTFRAATLVLTVWWFISAAKAYGYAKRRLVALHKYWAWQFLATGFAVGTMRIFMMLILLPWYPSNGERVLDKEEQDVLVGYTLWLAFFVSTCTAHLVVGREVALGSNIKGK
ncbi:hypothetical protein BWQ96_09222 [Gracilariopsis chorda]|uniref:Uncharacterized protein n=1 Tax=Gracilariopsis chorda TaxID=448386 RepID=A0A2V3IG55_9FLOR|nr:hypothetical protein BWQ96_09222 [Gracilariopsis chorda]|eukprot:PXF41057.1 hypothetical protein BWQ96_09222 [Gracilariopsis chorda]